MKEKLLTSVKTQAYQTYTVYSILLRKFHILWKMANKSSLHDLYENTIGAHAFNAILFCLISEYIKDLSLIVFDTTNKKNPSIKNLYCRITKNPQLVTRLKENFTKPLDHIWLSPPPFTGKELEEYELKLQQKRTSRRSEEFDNLLYHFVKYSEYLFEHPLLTKIKDVRDSVSSHYDIHYEKGKVRLKTISDYGVKWDELEIPIKLVRKSVDLGNIIICGCNNDFDGEEDSARRIANDFWDKLTPQ